MLSIGKVLTLFLRDIQGSFNNHVDKKRGEGSSQMSTLLNKSYQVRLSMLVERGSKMIKILHTWLLNDPLGSHQNSKFNVESSVSLSTPVSPLRLP